MNAAVKIEVATDPMATVRALKRMRRHGFTLRLVGNDLALRSPAVQD